MESQSLSLSSDLTEAIEAVREWQQNTLTGAQEVGRKICQVIERQPTALAVLKEQFPPRLVDDLIRAGKMEIHGRLLTASGSWAQKLKALPFPIQQAALTQGVEVFDLNRSESRWIPVDELSLDQVKQVFSGAGIRTPAQQRTWLESRMSKPKPTELKQHWWREKNTIATINGDRLTAPVLLQMLAALED